MGCNVNTQGEYEYSEHEVRVTARRYPEQADEQHEDQPGEPDVVLLGDHHHGETPSDQDRNQVSGVEYEPVADAHGWDGKQLLSFSKVRGKEDAQQDLGDLDRLELVVPEVDPQSRAVRLV